MKEILYLIFIISIFTHELAHLIVSEFLGKKFKMQFSLLGFHNKNLKLEGISKNKKILVFIAGPLINIIIAIIFIKIPCKFQNEIILTNLFLGVLNILPIIPLDGSNTLICFLEYKMPIERSIMISLYISKVLLIIISFIYCIFILVIKNLWLLILVLYLWYLHIREENKFELYLKIKRNADNFIKINKFSKIV